MKILVLGSVWPEPKSSAAGRRMMDLLDVFLKQKAEILFMTHAERRPHSEVLPEGIQTGELFLNDSRMDEIFRAYGPDLVLFDRFIMEEQYGWRIEKECPDALRILDTVDLHSLRSAREKALKEGRERNTSDWFSDMALREVASILRSDLSLLMSQAESDILQAELPVSADCLHVAPFFVSESECASHQPWPTYDQRKDIVTIGSFLHGPNKDSVQFLREGLWSSIRKKLPEANLYVYGADMSSHQQAWGNSREGFHMMGRAEDAHSVLKQARLCLAPLRYGAGLKGKLLDAMLTGTPSVTTPIGAEGMSGNLLWPGRIESDAEGLVDAVVDLYTNQKQWEISQKLIGPVLKGFDVINHVPLLMAQIESAKMNKNKHSKEQWIGALLRHHHHKSTEYMSRWIELKNQKEGPEKE